MLRNDVWVIYPSKEEEGLYVAHSLRTDQIGVGESIVDALVELIVALRALLKEARRDKTIDIYRDAPSDVWQMLNDAKRLPKEIEEIAHMRLAGRESRKLRSYMKRIPMHPRSPRALIPHPDLIHA